MLTARLRNVGNPLSLQIFSYLQRRSNWTLTVITMFLKKAKKICSLLQHSTLDLSKISGKKPHKQTSVEKRVARSFSSLGLRLDTRSHY